jgi:hypothetical protein
MASFIDKAGFGDAKKESAEKLVQSWRNACRDFADNDEKSLGRCTA